MSFCSGATGNPSALVNDAGEIAPAKRRTDSAVTSRVTGRLTQPARRRSSGDKTVALAGPVLVATVISGLRYLDGADPGLLKGHGDLAGSLLLERHQRRSHDVVRDDASLNQADLHGSRGLDVRGPVIDRSGDRSHPVIALFRRVVVVGLGFLEQLDHQLGDQCRVTDKRAI